MRLIDADALTKQLEEMADNEWNKSVGSSKGLEDAIDVVESMPTIKTFTLADIEEQYRKGLEKGLEEQRPHGEWIPVSERLPEDRRSVLVTAYWHETYQVMMASYFGDGVWWCVPFNNCGDHMQKLQPKAWMPLPEPYKKEGEAE